MHKYSHAAPEQQVLLGSGPMLRAVGSCGVFRAHSGSAVPAPALSAPAIFVGSPT